MFDNKKITYSTDPASYGVPLSVEEIETIIAALPSNLIKNKESLRHLLSRVLGTSLELRRVRAVYSQENEERSKNSSSSVSNSVNPMHAAQFLSPEQRSKLFDKFAQEKLAALEESKYRADLRTRQAEEVISGILGLATSGLLSTESYAVVSSFLKSLGFPVPDIPTKNLGFADPRTITPVIPEEDTSLDLVNHVIKTETETETENEVQ